MFACDVVLMRTCVCVCGGPSLCAGGSTAITLSYVVAVRKCHPHTSACMYVSNDTWHNSIRGGGKKKKKKKGRGGSSSGKKHMKERKGERRDKGCSSKAKRIIGIMMCVA
ncbi:hypothetical protein TcCL_Unassigned03266 [Trypanosoma cruzi]|nr:hypothetical protein TcCL_Unassigned03266 [Trypanosoma cruzi]